MKPEKSKKRERFDRNAEASSRGSYVRRAHLRMLRERHNANKDLVLEISSRTPVRVEFFGEYIRIKV